MPKPLVNPSNKMSDTYNKMKEISEKYGKLVINLIYLYSL